MNTTTGLQNQPVKKDKETFRIFAGSYPDNKAPLEELLSYSEELETTWNQKIRWVETENMHITWKFLGNITQSRIERAFKELEKIKPCLQPVELVFDTLIIWPRPSSPRQLVWSVRDQHNNIIENFKILEKAFKNCGFTKEKRPFKPHITLGRFKGNQKPEIPIEIPKHICIAPMRFNITNICIVKSELKQQGPVYTTIKSLDF